MWWQGVKLGGGVTNRKMWTFSVQKYSLMTHKQVRPATNWRFLCRRIVFMGSIQSNLFSFRCLRGYLFGRKNSLIKILPFVNDRVLGGWGERRAGRTCIWNAREMLCWYSSYHQIVKGMSEKRKASVLVLLMSVHRWWNPALLLHVKFEVTLLWSFYIC